jgi:D-glycero-D-manno-heptose 1,7-bisphosphate phosphatase
LSDGEDSHPCDLCTGLRHRAHPRGSHARRSHDLRAGRERTLPGILKYPGAAFLDRDGTINVKAPGKGQYIESPGELRLLDGVAPAIRRLNDAGIRVLVITNQRGIALGRLTHDDLTAIHTHLNQLLQLQAGARVDDFFYCPHHIGACDCRKPDVGLFLQAKQRWPDIDFNASVMIGDSENDVVAGRKLGITSILLGSDESDLLAAVDALLPEDPGTPGASPT